MPHPDGNAALNAPANLPQVPTTRILAIGRFLAPPDPAVMQAIMPKEVRQTAMLYLDGKISAWFSRQDERGVVFLLDVGTVDQARQLLEALPLGVAGLMRFDFIPLGPLKPLRLLLDQDAA
jgi:hypothetical protein